MKTLFATTALILSMTAATNAAGAAKADVLGGGPVYAPSEYTLYCQYINFGTKNVTPMLQQLFEGAGTTPIVSGSTCANNSTVLPNQTCYIYPESPISVQISCKVTFSGSATGVRGALQLYDEGYVNLLSTVELR